MRIKITVEIDQNLGMTPHPSEVQKYMNLAVEGIIRKHAGRLRGLGSGIYGAFTQGTSLSSCIELENEETKEA